MLIVICFTSVTLYQGRADSQLVVSSPQQYSMTRLQSQSPSLQYSIPSVDVFVRRGRAGFFLAQEIHLRHQVVHLAPAWHEHCE
ncbi:MAG: hypothetical protein ACREQK_05590 [Candidatus Binatia bacterium]